MSGAIIGINPTQVDTVAAFRPGTRGGFDHPTLGYQEYVYGKASGAVILGGAVVEQAGFTFAALTTANSGNGARVGVAPVALAANQFGWFQVYGKAGLRTAASAAANARLNTTATAGQLDDDGTAASKSVLGAVLLTATGGAAAVNADAVLNYPQVGITL